MSRSPAMSGKATAMKSLKEKWLSKVQSAEEKGEKGIGGSSTVTIHVDDQPPFGDHISKGRIHEHLEGGWGVALPKEHD